MSTAIILAGTRGDDNQFAREQGVPLKALIDISGWSMVEYVFGAVQKSELFENIVIVIDEKHLPKALAPYVICVTPREGPVESLRDAMKAAPADDYLITTADHPLLTTDIIKDFWSKASCSVNLGAVPLHIVQERFPQTKRTRLRFRDGGYSGANLFAFKGDASVDGLLSLWSRLQKHRKKPQAMARIIGLKTLFKYFFTLGSFQQILDDIGRKVEVDIGLVSLGSARAAIDVDKDGDLKIAQAILEGELLP